MTIPVDGTRDSLRVLYFAVHDRDYPRNRRIRSYLAGLGHSVTVVDKPVSKGPRRWVGLLRALLTESARHDVIVVSEFALSVVPLAWVFARLHGKTLVVDGFVSLYETHVEDWASYSPSSFHARLYRAADRYGLRLADLYLVDTELRARKLRDAEDNRGTPVISLPVGAPAWALPLPAPQPAASLRVLYYGNYIPLHGLDVVIGAIADASATTDISATFLGDGEGRAAVELAVQTFGIERLVTFRGPVPEAELREVMSSFDVVLGVFGRSDKARTIIANKVWQGLACARVVVTQESEALDEIREIVGGQLVTTEPHDAAALANTLAALSRSAAAVQPRDTELAEYVEERFAGFSAWLRIRSARRQETTRRGQAARVR
jgi:hypothetical protein